MLSLGKDRIFLVMIVSPTPSMGFGTRNACCVRNVCFDEMKKGATCGETGLGNYIYLRASLNTCAPPWPGWCHVLSTQSEWGMEAIMWISLAEWTTHSNINCLVILGGSSLKPKELEWLPTLSISLDSVALAADRHGMIPHLEGGPQQIRHTNMRAQERGRTGVGVWQERVPGASLSKQENLLAWPLASFTLLPTRCASLEPR